jgi:DNA-binding XRE family transcriptional regulator
MEKSNPHPLRTAREECNLTIDELAEEVKVGAKTIWNAENNRPISAKCRRLICDYFGKTSQELGLIGARRGEKVGQSLAPELSVNISSDESTPIVPPRETFLLNGIALPTGKYVSQHERFQLTQSLGTSFQSCWKQLISTSPVQSLAAGQTLLYIVQQAHSLFQPDIRYIFYSSAYNLIGIALHFQGYENDAFEAHDKAYIAALEGNNPWVMAQTLVCQANIDQERSRYIHAQQAIEAAIRLASHQQHKQEKEDTYLLQAHLFALNAQNAAYMGETEKVARNLLSSEILLDYLPTSHEEFDIASWHQYAGTCALISGQYDIAIQELEQALDTLPPQWVLRHTLVFIPLILAYAKKREYDAVLSTVEKAFPAIRAFNSPNLNKQLMKYLQDEIQILPSNNEQLRDLLITLV